MAAVTSDMLRDGGVRGLLEERHDDLRREMRIRTTVPRELLPVRFDLSSNDYLGLSTDPEVVRASQEAIAKHGLGAASSRVVSGTTAEHELLEHELASFLGADEALVFGAGYLANTGLLGTLVHRDDLVIADRLIHASLIDGVLLTRARFERFRHNDPNDLERRLVAARRSEHRGRIFIITESVFSMDGDLAPLSDLMALACRFDALLIVDEAHALGVFGPAGAGRVREALGPQALGSADAPILLTATLSKAFGSYGGIVAGPRPLRSVLVSSCRSFIFNTALPPAFAAGARAAVARIIRADSERENLRSLMTFCVDSLASAGVEVMRSGSQIVPLVLGDGSRVLRTAEGLLGRGIRVAAIRRPTVPPGGERIRLSLTAKFATDDLRWIVEQIVEELRKG